MKNVTIKYKYYINFYPHQKLKKKHRPLKSVHKKQFPNK